MVDFLQLQEIIRGQLAQDRSIRIVTVNGPTLEEAVSQAAILLNIPVRRLEYEITEKGTPGFFGSGKKDWTINAYERLVIKTSIEDDEESEAAGGLEKVIEDLDGDAFINLSTDGVLLKVIPPTGMGRKISEADTMRMIRERNVTDVDEELVGLIVREAKGE